MHQGKNIKHIRKIKGMTMADLACTMGTNPLTGKPISTSAISQFESSEFLREKTLKKIAEGLSVQVDVITKIDFDEVIDLGLEETCKNIFTMYPYHPTPPYNKTKQYDILNEKIAEEKEKVLANAYIIESRSKVETDSLLSLCNSIFNSLNIKGQEEAVKRIGELAQLEEYTRKD